VYSNKASWVLVEEVWDFARGHVVIGDMLQKRVRISFRTKMTSMMVADEVRDTPSPA